MFSHNKVVTVLPPRCGSIYYRPKDWSCFFFRFLCSNNLGHSHISQQHEQRTDLQTSCFTFLSFFWGLVDWDSEAGRLNDRNFREVSLAQLPVKPNMYPLRIRLTWISDFPLLPQGLMPRTNFTCFCIVTFSGTFNFSK